MSFASSVSSTLVPINPKYPTTDILSAGYVEIPDLDYTPTAIGVYIDAFTPINLPYGVWLLTGVLQFEATAGNLTQAVAHCRLNGVTNQGQMVSVGSLNGLVMPISFVVSSGTAGAEDSLDLAITATTSGGATWSLTPGITSILKLVRIA